jgi:hypothetical protein
VEFIKKPSFFSEVSGQANQGLIDFLTAESIEKTKNIETQTAVFS